MRASSSESGCGGKDPADEPLLGSADIQSLADLRNGFLVIEGIHRVPFTMKNCHHSGCDYAGSCLRRSC